MSENGEIYTAGKNFTLLPALTGWTNSTSGWDIWCFSFVEQGKGNVILLNTSVARISNDVLNIYEM